MLKEIVELSARNSYANGITAVNDKNNSLSILVIILPQLSVSSVKGCCKFMI